jgi:hypothetical protein
VATSTVKAVILIAVVVIGVLVLRSAFPDNASEGIAPAASTPPATGLSPTPDVSPPVPTTQSPTAKPRKNRTTVQFLNGTDKQGFAGEWTQALQADKWKATDPANGNTTENTRIFYRPDFLVEAQAIQQTYFPPATLEEAGTSVPAEVEVQVLLGADAPEPPGG